MPKADEGIQNALFHRIWNWSLQVRARQMCEAKRKVQAANTLSILQLSTILPQWSNAITQFLSHEKVRLTCAVVLV